MSRRAGSMVGSAVRRGAVWFATFAVASVTFSTSAFAHAGSLAGSLRSVPAPFWLVVSGGGVVCVSFLLSAFVTDDETLDAFERAGVRIGGLAGAVATAEAALKLLGVAALVLVVAFGLFGPPVGIANLGVLLVWVGWWAGFTMAAYLVGNAWPLVNPWRTLGAALRGRFATGGRLSRPTPTDSGRGPASPVCSDSSGWRSSVRSRRTRGRSPSWSSRTASSPSAARSSTATRGSAAPTPSRGCSDCTACSRRSGGATAAASRFRFPARG